MMVLAGRLLAPAVRFHQEHTRYAGRGAKLLESLERILNFESENIDFSPRWLEKEELLSQVQGIAAAHRSNRELAEHRVYRTLEAFIPRLWEILSHSVPCDRRACYCGIRLQRSARHPSGAGLYRRAEGYQSEDRF